MKINPDEMKLTRVTFGLDPAWLWHAPNGTKFYLQKAYGYSFWNWWRIAEHSKSPYSSNGYSTLRDVKEALAHAYSDEDETPNDL